MNWILCIFVILFSGCQQKLQETHYKEIVLQAPQANTPNIPQSSQANPTSAPAGGNMFTWAAPQGWKEEPGEGMRLATFHLLSDAKAIDCSIVSLGGTAGGLELNLRRWMGQIGLQATPDKLGGLISSAPSTKIKTGQEGKIFDFTAVQSGPKLTDKSMIVVMVTMDEATLFVKMAGTVDTIGKNKDDFFKLVGSIEYHAPSAGAVMPSAGMNSDLLAWGLPEGWKQEAGIHMRMATFHSIAAPQAIDCSIIALPGPAGGLEANLERWLGQLGLQASDDYLKQLLMSVQDVVTKGGLDTKVFDFTALHPQGSPSDESMIVAMMEVDQMTVFVKMTGSIEAVKENKGRFLKLLGSITRK